MASALWTRLLALFVSPSLNLFAQSCGILVGSYKFLILDFKMKLLVLLVSFAHTLPLLAMSVSYQGSPQSRRGLPIPIHKRGTLNAHGSVSPHFLQTNIQQSVDKFSDGFSAYERNTGERHPLDWLPEPNLQEKRDMGSIPLAPADQQLWYGSISVGTPAKKFLVDFDTGSSDLFLPGPRCEETCSGHAAYDPSESYSASNTRRTFFLKFGDGSTATVEGYTDVVSIAGLSAKGQVVGVASEYSTGFSISKFTPDGLLGLGFQSVSKYNATPFFINLISQGIVSNPVFGVRLANEGSELFLGGTNGELYQGDFTYTPVTKEGYWQVILDGIMLDGREVVSVTQAIIDTGSTLILGPAEVVEAIYGRIPGAIPALDPNGIKSGLYTVPCNFDMTIALKFGKRAFPIAPSIFNLGPVNGQPNRCYGGMASQSKIARFWILGDTFLQNVYTAFDFGRKSVGFASLVEPS